MRTLGTLACILMLAGAATADEVELLNGGRFKGVVTEQGDRVVVDTQYGSMSFKRIDVKRIDYSKPSSLQELEARMKKADLESRKDLENLLAWAETRKLKAAAAHLRKRLLAVMRRDLDYRNDKAVAEVVAWARRNGDVEAAVEVARGALALKRAGLMPGDAQGRYELGLWARSMGVEVDALILFKDAITIEPDHEFARRALGYVRHQGQWMTDSEVKKSMGLIEFEGQWITPAGKEAIITARTLEKERRLLEEERRKLEAARDAARADQERRLAELQARSLELERQIQVLRSRPVYVYRPRVVVPPPDCQTSPKPPSAPIRPRLKPGTLKTTADTQDVQPKP